MLYKASLQKILEEAGSHHILKDSFTLIAHDLFRIEIVETMAVAATNSATFHLFTSLPPELRNQIWRAALPEKVGPALSIYKKGLWRPRRLTEGDEGYDPVRDHLNLYFDWRHDRLDNIPFQIPLMYVNREARDLALGWVRRHGLEIRPRKDGQYPICVRPFDPSQDALFVACDKWDDFLWEPDRRLSKMDLFDKLVSWSPALTHVAVSVALLRTELDSLSSMFEYFFNLKVLLVIMKTHSDLPSAGKGVQAQQCRWEYESIHDGALFWNARRRGFHSRSNNMVVDEALCRLLEGVNKRVGELFALKQIPCFEIRPVIAVRR